MIVDPISSLIACTLTLLAFLAARRFAVAAGGHPLANPILIAALLTGGLVAIAGWRLEAYIAAARPLGPLLDMSIVALGALLFRNADAQRGRVARLALAIVIGSATGIASAVALARVLGLSEVMQQALSVKSVSSGFAIALMERLGGPPPLAAGLVIVTGMIGALVLPPLLKPLGLGGDGPTGAGVGMAAHIIGTDALARSRPGAAPVAALAMALAGLVTAILLPTAWNWLF